MSRYPHSPKRLARRRTLYDNLCHPPSRHRGRTVVGAARSVAAESSRLVKQPSLRGRPAWRGHGSCGLVVFLSRWARIFSIRSGSSIWADDSNQPAECRAGLNRCQRQVRYVRFKANFSHSSIPADRRLRVDSSRRRGTQCSVAHAPQVLARFVVSDVKVYTKKA